MYSSNCDRHFQAVDAGPNANHVLRDNTARGNPFRGCQLKKEPLVGFKSGLPSQESLPRLKGPIDLILRSLSQEARGGFCRSLQFRQRGSAFPTKIKVVLNRTYSRIGHLPIEKCDEDFISEMFARSVYPHVSWSFPDSSHAATSLLVASVTHVPRGYLQSSC